jgi:hypothetical protein
MALPDTLHLGSGRHFMPEFFNADILERVNPDWLCDITNIKWGETVETKRFGPVKIEKGMFKRIVTHDCLEHIPDLVQAMTNCRDLLCKGGTMEIGVPYWLSLGADQDPTHVRRFNEMSFIYYADWAWYLGWPDSDRFEVLSIQFKKSAFGETLKGDMASILRTPTAVDKIYCTMRRT